MLRPCGEAGQQRLAFACWVREPPWLSLGLFAAGKGGEIPIEGAIVKALENRYHFQVGGLCPPARIARVFDYVMRNRAAKAALCGPKAADLKSATFQVF